MGNFIQAAALFLSLSSAAFGADSLEQALADVSTPDREKAIKGLETLEKLKGYSIGETLAEEVAMTRKLTDEVTMSSISPSDLEELTNFRIPNNPFLPPELNQILKLTEPVFAAAKQSYPSCERRLKVADQLTIQKEQIIGAQTIEEKIAALTTTMPTIIDALNFMLLKGITDELSELKTLINKMSELKQQIGPLFAYAEEEAKSNSDDSSSSNSDDD